MKALVLCSGGLDSTVLLHQAVKKLGADNVVALNMYYGQKHAKEQTFAEWQCEHLHVPLYNADLSEVFRFNKDCCSLLEGSSLEIEHKSYAEQLADGAKTVSAYVPYRNGLFLSYAASVAIQLECDAVIYGAHADDAAGSAYPDCTPEFIDGQAKAIYEGTGKQVTLQAPFWNTNKAGIVAEGIKLGMTIDDFIHTWSCYEGGDEPCGTCGTCIDRKNAFIANGIMDIL